jgi:hypothetical protein
MARKISITRDEDEDEDEDEHEHADQALPTGGGMVSKLVGNH